MPVASCKTAAMLPLAGVVQVEMMVLKNLQRIGGKK